jgi:predicted transposase/invertase (TIGR01784 family)
MYKSILSPKSDTIFKLIFGEQKNVDILASFLQAVLDLPEEEYAELFIVNPNIERKSPKDKLSIVDVMIKTKTGKTVEVEIQKLAIPEMKERIVYYASKIIAGQIKKGDGYANIKKVVSIVITDYILIGDNKEYHNRYKLYDRKTGSEFTDILEINTLELPKLPQGKDGTELFDWLKFINSQDKEELEMLAECNPKLKRAVGVLLELSEDEKTRMLYEAEEKARLDEDGRMRGALQQGIEIGQERGLAKGREEGIAQGELEGRKFAARRFRAMGLPVDKIAEATGLSIEEVERLK